MSAPSLKCLYGVCSFCDAPENIRNNRFSIRGDFQPSFCDCWDNFPRICFVFIRNKPFIVIVIITIFYIAFFSAMMFFLLFCSCLLLFCLFLGFFEPHVMQNIKIFLRMITKRFWHKFLHRLNYNIFLWNWLEVWRYFNQKQWIVIHILVSFQTHLAIVVVFIHKAS